MEKILVPGNIDDLPPYEVLRERLAVILLPKDNNDRRLDQYPSYTYLNLAAFVVAEIRDGEVGDLVPEQSIAQCYISNKMIEHYGITAEKLFEDAMKFSAVNRPLAVKTLGSVVASRTGEPEPVGGPQFYVVSNTQGILGASAMLYPAALDSVAALIGGRGFFVLPSSVHEVLCVPDDDVDYRELELMVRGINATTVAPDERLSDDVYYYDAEKKQLIFARDRQGLQN